MGNVFGNVAAQAAYSMGDEWLDQLIDYIDGNIQYVMQFAEMYLPLVKVIRPEATYMAWIDFSGLGMDDKALNKFIIHEAGLGLNQGIQFGPGGEGFMRMNLACPRSVLRKGMEQLKEAVNGIIG
jgi:cystathionine beta-lyase